MQRGEARGEGSLKFSLGPRLGVTSFGEKFSVIIWLLQGATPRRQGSPWPPISPRVQHPALFTTPPPSGLGLWCQAHVTVSMLCNELLKPFQPSEIHLMVVTWPLGRQMTSFVFVSGWAGVGVCAQELAHQCFLSSYISSWGTFTLSEPFPMAPLGSGFPSHSPNHRAPPPRIPPQRANGCVPICSTLC